MVEQKMKIGIVGAGYVGLSNAILLAKHNDVVIYDICKEKIALLNKKTSPLDDPDIKFYLENEQLNLVATQNQMVAFDEMDYVIIATPTDYDPDKNNFITDSVELTIHNINIINPNCTIIIKSTVPVGFTTSFCTKFGYSNVIFSPEFLREGRALYDNLHPSRIIIGENSERAKLFAELMLKGTLSTKSVDVLFTSATEAEAIKLFSNSYLAMRVAFFNELDTYALTRNLNSFNIIKGVCLDPRIGQFYNNPSFGYGGYCLPKDTKQLLANYGEIPNDLISAIVESNSTRKKFIAEVVLAKSPKILGVYRLIMKSGSDNYRASAIIDIIQFIKTAGVEVIVYEPTLDDVFFLNCEVMNDFDEFKSICDLIISNRVVPELCDVENKVFTRDIFGYDL